MNNSNELNAILKRISENDPYAFRLFYDKFYIQIYRFASYFIKNNETKEEIISDVFFSIWQNRLELLNIDNIVAYLFTITRNRALYYINKSKNIESLIIDDIPLGMASSDLTPEEIYINEELVLAIQSAINELPERCKLIFLMAKEEGLKYREIAEILSISEKTVNAQIVIAIKKLAYILKKKIIIFLAII